MEVPNPDDILGAIRYLSQKRVPATRAAMLDDESMTKWNKDEKALGLALDELIANGSILASDGAYALTPQGSKRAQEIDAREFGEWMIACEHSAAYHRLCEQLYGSDLCQFNMMTQTQLEKLLDVLNLSSGQSALDLGCGIGTLTEYIADRTGGIVMGIDFSPEAIAFAQERLGEQGGRVSFQVMDMDDLALMPKSFDAVLSVDTLYFVKELQKTAVAIKNALREQGRMAAFFSAKIAEEEARELLEPEGTLLARALKESGLAFETWDFTADEGQFWENQLRIARELRNEFEDEGNLAIYEGRIGEATRELGLFMAGRRSRYLYRAWNRTTA